MQTLEKKLVEEQRARSTAEAALTAERKKEAGKAAAAAKGGGDCSEACRGKRREVETELRRARAELRSKEDALSGLELQLKDLHMYREKDRKEDELLATLESLQERNNHLQKALSAENRLKQDLFSALGEANRRLELAQMELGKKTRELEARRVGAGGGMGMGGGGGSGLGRVSPDWGLGGLSGAGGLGLGNGAPPSNSAEMDHNLHALAAVAAAHSPFLYHIPPLSLRPWRLRGRVVFGHRSNGLGSLGNGLVGGLVEENGGRGADGGGSSPALSFTPPRSN